MGASLPKRHAGSPLRTNAHINRTLAAGCLNAGMTPADIVAEWPEVWRLVDGKLAQIYDYELADGSGRYETNRLITRDSVAAAIRKHQAKTRKNGAPAID